MTTKQDLETLFSRLPEPVQAAVQALAEQLEEGKHPIHLDALRALKHAVVEHNVDAADALNALLMRAQMGIEPFMLRVALVDALGANEGTVTAVVLRHDHQLLEHLVKKGVSVRYDNDYALRLASRGTLDCKCASMRQRYATNEYAHVRDACNVLVDLLISGANVNANSGEAVMNAIEMDSMGSELYPGRRIDFVEIVATRHPDLSASGGAIIRRAMATSRKLTKRLVKLATDWRALKAEGPSDAHVLALARVGRVKVLQEFMREGYSPAHLLDEIAANAYTGAFMLAAFDNGLLPSQSTLEAAAERGYPEAMRALLKIMEPSGNDNGAFRRAFAAERYDNCACLLGDKRFQVGALDHGDIARAWARGKTGVTATRALMRKLDLGAAVAEVDDPLVTEFAQKIGV